MVKDFEKYKAVIMTRTVTSWRDTVASSWHNCSTSQELIARITSFLNWILRFRGQIFRKNQSRHRDVYRDVMTEHRDVIMTLFNISGTICPNYVVFVLNPMFSGSRISKKQSRHCGVYRDVMTGHTNIITSLFNVTVSRYEVTVHRDDDGFVFFEILDPENIWLNTKTT